MAISLKRAAEVIDAGVDRLARQRLLRSEDMQLLSGCLFSVMPIGTPPTAAVTGVPDTDSFPAEPDAEDEVHTVRFDMRGDVLGFQELCVKRANLLGRGDVLLRLSRAGDCLITTTTSPDGRKLTKENITFSLAATTGPAADDLWDSPAISEFSAAYFCLQGSRVVRLCKRLQSSDLVGTFLRDSDESTSRKTYHPDGRMDFDSVSRHPEQRQSLHYFTGRYSIEPTSNPSTYRYSEYIDAADDGWRGKSNTVQTYFLRVCEFVGTPNSMQPKIFAIEGQGFTREGQTLDLLHEIWSRIRPSVS